MEFALRLDNKSRMSREVPVRFREGLGVRFPRATRLVLGFQHRRDAARFLRELRERLQKFGLALHPEKTRLIEFGRFAARDRLRRGEGKPETFDFLGFTHICGHKLQSKRFIVKRMTIAKRLRAKLEFVRQALTHRLHEPIRVQGAWLRGLVQGYFNYHAIPGNLARLETFRTQVLHHWLRTLRRRSQRHRMPWTRFAKLAIRWIPRPQIMHPYPNVRFYATHPR
jgi:hypothetical protein